MNINQIIINDQAQSENSLNKYTVEKEKKFDEENDFVSNTQMITPLKSSFDSKLKNMIFEKATDEKRSSNDMFEQARQSIMQLKNSSESES